MITPQMYMQMLIRNTFEPDKLYHFNLNFLLSDQFLIKLCYLLKSDGLIDILMYFYLMTFDNSLVYKISVHYYNVKCPTDV